MFNKSNKFSLIELIIVIAVLGLLATIVIPNINGMQEKAYLVHIKGNIRDIQTAVDMYRIDHGSYPVGVQPTPSSPQFIDFNLLYPEYLKNLPTYNERYWIDFLGTVWGSHTDIPTMKGQGTSVVSWEAVSGVERYAIYEVIDKNGQTTTSLVGSVTGSTGTWQFNSSRNYSRKELFEIKAFPESKVVQFFGDVGKQYIVASQDNLGFYTAPGGDELDTPVSLEEGEFERTMYVNTAAPSIADWLSLSDKKIVPEGSSITYEFAYSNNGGKTLSDWYTDIKDVPDSTYLRVKIVLKGTETARPILQQLKVNYRLKQSEAEACTINLYQEDQDCNMEQSKAPVTSETIKVDQVIPPKGNITVPIPDGKPVTSVVPSYSGTTNPDISYSDGENSFDHPSQGNPSDIIIKNPSDQPLEVPDVTINRTEKPPTVQTGEPEEDNSGENGSTDGSLGSGENGGNGDSNGSGNGSGGNPTEKPTTPEVQESWKEVDRFVLIEDAGEEVTWTSVDFTQNKPNSEKSRLRVSIDGTSFEDYKSGTSIGKNSQELRINFIGEVEKTSNLTWKDVPYPDSVTVHFKTKDGTEKTKEYDIEKSEDGVFNKELVQESTVKPSPSPSPSPTPTPTPTPVPTPTPTPTPIPTPTPTPTPIPVKPVINVNITPTGNITTDTIISANVTVSGEPVNIVEEKWFVDDKPQSTKPTGPFVEGGHVIGVQVKTEEGVWSDLVQATIKVEQVKVEIASVVVGSKNAAVITSTGDVYAWGDTYDYVLPPDFANKPTKLSTVSKVKSLAFSRFTGAAVTEDGKVYTWGMNDSGELGNPDIKTRYQSFNPTQAQIDGKVQSIVAGTDTFYALMEDGTVYSWGYNGFGVTGQYIDEMTYQIYQPAQLKYNDGTVVKNVKQVFANNYYSGFAVLEDGTLLGWGSDARKVLGNNGKYTRYYGAVPSQGLTKEQGKKIKKITSDMNITLVLLNDGTVYYSGQVKTNGTDADVGMTKDVSLFSKTSLSGVQDIALTSSATFVLKSDGYVYGWGVNSSGVLGIDETISYSTLGTGLTKISSLSNVKAINSFGSNAMFAETKDGKLYAWGSNSSNRLGFETGSSFKVPTELSIRVN